MATAELLPGNRFRLYRKHDSGTTFDYVGLATTMSFTRTNSFEDATAPDLADPFVTPTRESALRSTMWDLTFSGRVDAKAFEVIEGDAEDEAPHTYQIQVDRTSAEGGKTYTGALWYEKLEMGTQDRGFVTFTATCRGEGPYVRAAVS